MQACKVEDLGKIDFDEEIKKRFKMVYVPNWFSVDLKTGVSHVTSCLFNKFGKKTCFIYLIMLELALVLLKVLCSGVYFSVYVLVIKFSLLLFRC